MTSPDFSSLPLMASTVSGEGHGHVGNQRSIEVASQPAAFDFDHDVIPAVGLDLATTGVPTMESSVSTACW